jgi:5-enolpyruvylshikimate-3-phosphate synthase
MALAVAGMVAQGETTLSGAEAMSISYPCFWQHLAELESG